MDKVLVPIDGSDRAEKALRFALDRFPDDEITILHVIDPKGDSKAGSEWYNLWYEDREKMAEDILSDAEEIAESHEPEIETVVRSGIPSKQILDYASEHDIDQIVIGTLGNTGLKRLLVGSVAMNVVRHSNIPVTVVH